MKKVTYQSKIYTVEETFGSVYLLSGGEVAPISDCTHWLSGWFYKFFKFFG